MSDQIIKFIKINNLQYNTLRDPQVYRRVAGEALRIQVGVGGRGAVRVTLADEKGTNLVQGDVQAPGTFSHELTFARPGVRIVTIGAQHADRSESRDMRLDIMAHAWVG
ncbi:MAG: hypothetical protein EHM16_04700 [Betaproteobacteria bacterium]|nr:MAG: hypothetical protein EHM16_04700 [Betaproteobacteria bacterium]